jgi:hypothetical protein
MSNIDPVSRDKAQRLIIDRLSKRTNEEIELLFEEANKTDTPISRVQEIVSEISGYIGFLLLPIAQHHFYRARYWGDKKDYPENLSQLLEPEPKNTRQNRCNVENKPALYVSTHPIALVSECHFKTGDIFAMAQFDRSLETVDLSCMMLGIDPHHRFEGSPEMDNIAQFKREFFGNNHQKYQFIEQQLHKQFVRDDDKEGITYRFTANLCEKYFSSCPDLDAIVYPSIATQGSFTNLAIRPHMYSKAYIGKKMGIFEVLKDGSYRQLAATLVGSTGELNWRSMPLIDQPKAVGIRKIDPNDPRIYIAPWKNS